MSAATVSQPDMREWNITSQIKIDGTITPDFSYDWAVLFQGHKYIQPLREPQAGKENTSLDSTIDLEFQHWAIYQLKRWPFVTMQPIEAGVAIEDEEVASVSLNLKDFCDLTSQVLAYYYGDSITIDLNPDWAYKIAPTVVEIQHSYVWEVIQKLQDLYGVRWRIEPNGSQDKYVIKVGYETEAIDHVFEYGYEGALLKVERQVQNPDIRNMIKGRGGETNLPRYYFKKSDDEELFRSDPDWVPELKDIYFSNLRGATFRSYIQGWKAKHYGGTVAKEDSFAPWAWQLGYDDTKFHPVEYVKDDDSIAKYGPLLTTLDSNEEIHPSIQNAVTADLGRLDEIVAIERQDEVTDEDSDNYPAYAPTGSYLADVTRDTIPANKTKNVKMQGVVFRILPGYKANLIADVAATLVGGSEGDTAKSVEIGSVTSYVYNQDTGERRVGSGIPEGQWRYELIVPVHNLTASPINVELYTPKVDVVAANITEDSNPNTFDIWIKNVWGSEKGNRETDAQYAERVWRPILGDREGNEAAVMFSDGELAVSDDYEFKIPKNYWPVYDTSKSIEEKDEYGQPTGRSFPSHWKLTLAKSDADMESTGEYVPGRLRKGHAGDHFLFIGTEMTHDYTLWAEIRVEEWKQDALEEKSSIKPMWVVSLDKNRISQLHGDEVQTILSQFRPGRAITLYNKHFIDGSHEEIRYIDTITYNFREPTKEDAALDPDVEIILSDGSLIPGTTIDRISGEINALQQQIGSLSNVAGVVKTVGDKRYIRKDTSDRTPYSLGVGGVLDVEKLSKLLGGATFGDFIEGLYAGKGARIDEHGNSEFESLRVRSFMEVMELVVNRTTAIEGDQIFTEGDTVERVVDLGNGVYGLYLHSKYDGYFTAQAKNNILKCIFNTLPAYASGLDTDESTRPEKGEYYTSWVRVNSVNTAANYIEVTLYSDSEVPGGRNFPPCEMMNVSRWGNQTDETRQRCFYISSTEGRIVFLRGVTKPIVDRSNYEVVIGRPPEFLKEEDPSISDERGYVYALGFYGESFNQITHQGKPIIYYVDSGEYVIGKEYHFEWYNAETRRYETWDVWYRGCKWRCCKDGITSAPSWNNTDWAMLEGNPDFILEIAETPVVFDPETFNVTLDLHAYLYNTDVTADIPKTDIMWGRYTEGANGEQRSELDNAWNRKHEEVGSVLTLTPSDLDFDGVSPKFVRFTADVLLIDSSGRMVAVGQVSRTLTILREGDSTVMYTITASPSALTMNKYGVLSASSVDFVVMRHSGGNAPQTMGTTSPEGAVALKCVCNGEERTPRFAAGRWSVDAFSESFDCVLYVADREVQRTTILVVKDGIDGTNGGDVVNGLDGASPRFFYCLWPDPIIKPLPPLSSGEIFDGNPARGTWSTIMPNPTDEKPYVYMAWANFRTTTNSSGESTSIRVTDWEVARLTGEAGMSTPVYKLMLSTGAAVRNTDGGLTPSSVQLTLAKFLGDSEVEISDEEWEEISAAILYEKAFGGAGIEARKNPDKTFAPFTFPTDVKDSSNFTIELRRGQSLLANGTIPVIPLAEGVPGQGWQNCGQWQKDVNYFWDKEGDVPVRPYVWVPNGEGWETDTSKREYYYRDGLTGDCLNFNPATDSQNSIQRHWKKFGVNVIAMFSQLIQAEDIDTDRLVAKQVRVRDSQGKTLCSIDGDSGKVVVGGQDGNVPGQRVEIVPSTKSVNIFDEENNQCLTLAGNRRGGTIEDYLVDGQNAIGPFNLYSGLCLASPNSPLEGAMTTETSSEIIKEGTILHVSGALELWQLAAGQSVPTVPNDSATANVSLFIELIDPSTMERFRYQSVGDINRTAYGSNSVDATVQINGRVLAERDCKVRFRMWYTLKGSGVDDDSTNYKSMCRFQAVSLRVDPMSDIYTASVFANGLLFSKSKENYFGIMENSTGNMATSYGFVFQARATGYGIKVSKDGTSLWSEALGKWSPQPISLLTARWHGASGGAICPNGYNFGLRTTFMSPSQNTGYIGWTSTSNTSEVKIGFPMDWNDRLDWSRIIVRAHSQAHSTVVSNVQDNATGYKSVTIQAFNSSGTAQAISDLSVEILYIP